MKAELRVTEAAAQRYFSHYIEEIREKSKFISLIASKY